MRSTGALEYAPLPSWDSLCANINLLQLTRHERAFYKLEDTKTPSGLAR